MSKINLEEERLKLEEIYWELRDKFLELIEKSTSNLTNEDILTPIDLIIETYPHDRRHKVAITEYGIRKWIINSNSNEISFSKIISYEFKNVLWDELVFWIRNYTDIDSNIFYQIGKATYIFKLIPEMEHFYRMSIGDNKSSNSFVILTNTILDQKRINLSKHKNLLVIEMSEYNAKLKRYNEYNRKVVDNLKEELNYKLVLEEI